jgi:hypothetical protein
VPLPARAGSEPVEPAGRVAPPLPDEGPAGELAETTPEAVVWTAVVSGAGSGVIGGAGTAAVVTVGTETVAVVPGTGAVVTVGTETVAVVPGTGAVTVPTGVVAVTVVDGIATVVDVTEVGSAVVTWTEVGSVVGTVVGTDGTVADGTATVVVVTGVDSVIVGRPSAAGRPVASTEAARKPASARHTNATALRVTKSPAERPDRRRSSSSLPFQRMVFPGRRRANLS